MREITPMTGKETSGKLNLSLVPPEIVTAVAHIREYGCRKYESPDNWKDVDPEMFNQAMQRHVMACWNDWGAIDEESKMPHIWHIACNVAFLCQFLKDGEYGMARITLINGYYIDKGPLIYTLKQKYIGTGKNEQPKEIERTIGYFGNMTDAVEECIKRICDDETASFDDDIKEYAEVIDLIARNAVSKLQKVLEGM